MFLDLTSDQERIINLAKDEADHFAARQTGSYRRIDPGFHSFAWRLRDSADTWRRQAHDAGQPNRAAVRPGQELAPGLGALLDASDVGDVCAALLRAKHRKVPEW